MIRTLHAGRRTKVFYNGIRALAKRWNKCITVEKKQLTKVIFQKATFPNNENTMLGQFEFSQCSAAIEI